MTNAEISELGIKLFNENKIDEWTDAIAADDIALEDVAIGHKAFGKEEAKAYVKNWKTTFPDMVGKCNNRVESGNTMFEECSWTGTNTGEINAPDGSKIPPTGKSVNINNCFVYEFENGKIKSMKNYLDTMSMMGQLGLAG
jgi:steroid delta-isomerase-like uncharacterized protein|tara:strand:- start:48 stop:470 length:423 start_codon:yes stop_codon:yes gene_type:complete